MHTVRAGGIPGIAHKDLAAQIGAGGQHHALCLYKQAALFVFPSFAEGFGIPPIEAVAYSCPTLCSNQTAMAEFDFFHECFFSPYDIRELKNKIMYFIQNDVTQICEALQKEIVARYNWKNVGEKLYQLIKDDKK